MAFEVPERYAAFIDGREREGIDEFTVEDPATNESIATVTEAGKPAVRDAVTAGERALETWTSFDPAERADVLFQLGDVIRENVDRLATIETMENGRPLSQSRAVVEGAAPYFDYYAGIVDKIEGETIPVPGDRLNYTLREPLGVTGHIVPWNVQLLLGIRSIAPALAAGNTVVTKPSPEAPLSLLEFASLTAETDLPDGVFNVVPGDGSRTGAALTEDPRISKIVFTGSRGTGEHVMKTAAENVTSVGLELGGKNPIIVFPDADLEEAADDVRFVLCSNAGQVCFAVSRLFIHEDVYDEFLSLLVDRVEDITFGPGIEDPDMGPLVARDEQTRVRNYVESAVENDATVRTGGTIPRNDGNFFEPTIIEDADDDSPICCDEVFGPIVTAHEFSSESEAVRRANDTKLGLYATVRTNTLDRAHRVAEELEFGTVNVNEYAVAFPQSPFGGYKEAGLGREKGQQAIDHYTQLKSVTIKK